MGPFITVSAAEKHLALLCLMYIYAPVAGTSPFMCTQSGLFHFFRAVLCLSRIFLLLFRFSVFAMWWFSFVVGCSRFSVSFFQ